MPPRRLYENALIIALYLSRLSDVRGFAALCTIFPSTPSSSQKLEFMSAIGKVQAGLVEAQACGLPAECSGAGLLHFQRRAQTLLPATISQNASRDGASATFLFPRSGESRICFIIRHRSYISLKFSSSSLSSILFIPLFHPLPPSLPSSSSNLFSEHRQLSTFCLPALYLTNADPKIILQGRQALLIPRHGEGEAGSAGGETCSRPCVKPGGPLVDTIFPPLPPSCAIALGHFPPAKGNRTG